MDEEDLADAEEARKIATKDSFSGLGATSDDSSQRATVMDLFRASGDTMGTKLLQRMGWRKGQGIGPKVRRKARMNDEEGPETGEGDETHLFAPEDSQMISFVRKNDHKGLGYAGEGRLSEAHDGASTAKGQEDDEKDSVFSRGKKVKPKQTPRGSFGVGVLNDDGSGDEDPYQIVPRLAYNKSLGGEKKKNKKADGRSFSGSSNPLLRAKPVFISKKQGKGKEGSGPTRCHDGRPPLTGFILSIRAPKSKQEKKYPPPDIPADWKSSKITDLAKDASASQQTTAELARASTHDPSSRAKLLGETKLPGKSVFDFLTPTARSRIVGLTNNESLPAAGSEAPPSIKNGTSFTPAGEPAVMIPSLDPQTAAGALGRGVAGFIPYTDNPEKLARYRAFLSFRANLNPQAPTRPASLSRDDWLKELYEFAHAATIFKPMTGLMASRFTSSASKPFAPPTFTGTETNPENFLHTPSSSTATTAAAQIPSDPAVEAARMGMFGPLTRSTQPFFPSRLLCKRFNVPLPVVVAAQAQSGSDRTNTHPAPGFPQFPSSSSLNPASDITTSRFQSGGFQQPQQQQQLSTSSSTAFNLATTATAISSAAPKTTELLSKADMNALRREAGLPSTQEEEEENEAAAAARMAGDEDKEGSTEQNLKRKGKTIDPDRNEALEAERPGDAVFRAIFGDSSSDSDE